ncbi:MAG: hypothetical protein RR954_08115, partial [Christensenellaceae bacterium]
MVLLYQKSVWIAILHFSLSTIIKKSGSSEKEAALKDLAVIVVLSERLGCRNQRALLVFLCSVCFLNQKYTPKPMLTLLFLLFQSYFPSHKTLKALEIAFSYIQKQ